MSVQAALQSVAGQLSRLTLATRGAAPYDPRRGYQRAVRPGLGTQGRQVTVLANHFALSLKAKQAFHYDVSSACQGGREERRGVCVSFVGVGSLCAARPPPQVQAILCILTVDVSSLAAASYLLTNNLLLIALNTYTPNLQRTQQSSRSRPPRARAAAAPRAAVARRASPRTVSAPSRLAV